MSWSKRCHPSFSITTDQSSLHWNEYKNCWPPHSIPCQNSCMSNIVLGNGAHFSILLNYLWPNNSVQSLYKLYKDQSYPWSCCHEKWDSNSMLTDIWSESVPASLLSRHCLHCHCYIHATKEDNITDVWGAALQGPAHRQSHDSLSSIGSSGLSTPENKSMTMCFEPPTVSKM